MPSSDADASFNIDFIMPPRGRHRTRWRRRSGERTAPPTRGGLELRVHSEQESTDQGVRARRLRGRHAVALIRIPARVFGAGEEVLAHGVDRPIAGDVANATDVITGAELAKLQEGRILEGHRVDAVGVVEATDTRRVIGRRSTPVVAERLRVLHRLADLVLVVRHEIAE